MKIFKRELKHGLGSSKLAVGRSCHFWMCASISVTLTFFKKLGDCNLLPGLLMNNLDVLGRDSNMRHSLPQADCFINNTGWWKIFLQLFYSYSKHASFPHSSWSNRWIKELPKTHCRSIWFWRKTHQAYFPWFCSFRICTILRKSVLQEVTNNGSKYSWLGVQAHTYGKWRNSSKY